MKNKNFNWIGVVALIIAILALFTPIAGDGRLGGSSDSGYNATANGVYAVDGTTVIDGSGNVDAPITSSTGTFSSTLDVTGAFSAGATTISGTLSAYKLASTTTADDTLTVSQSGQLTWIGTTAATTTLPAVATAGTHYRFQVVATWTGANIAVTSAEGDNINGSLWVADATVACSGEDHVNFINDGETIGDYVEFVSDGTNWNIVSSRGETAAKLTCTDPA